MKGYFKLIATCLQLHIKTTLSPSQQHFIIFQSKFTFVFVISISTIYSSYSCFQLFFFFFSVNPLSRNTIVLYTTLTVLENSEYDQVLLMPKSFFTFTYLLLLKAFSFSLKKPFSNSCKAGLVVIKSLSFCLSGKVLICPSFMKNSFTR